MHKQAIMFRTDKDHNGNKYCSSINAPIYEPKNKKPHIFTLCDTIKTKALIREVDNSNLPEDEKIFLRGAAWRHAIFHYERIADYYANASVDMQRMMEASALVIIDFNAAIEQGFVRLCDDIRKQYFEEYRDNECPS